MLGRYLRNIMPARQACLYLQGTTHLELAHRPTTKANGLSLAPGITVLAQAEERGTAPRPLSSFLSVKEYSSSHLFPLRIDACNL